MKTCPPTYCRLPVGQTRPCWHTLNNQQGTGQLRQQHVMCCSACIQQLSTSSWQACCIMAAPKPRLMDLHLAQLHHHAAGGPCALQQFSLRAVSLDNFYCTWLLQHTRIGASPTCIIMYNDDDTCWMAVTCSPAVEGPSKSSSTTHVTAMLTGNAAGTAGKCTCAAVARQLFRVQVPEVVRYTAPGGDLLMLQGQLITWHLRNARWPCML